MKKEYKIPKIRMVQLRDRICLSTASDGTAADPNIPAGAKRYNGFFDAMADEEEYEE